VKPSGCVVSPFTVNRSGTLIVRNRYRLLPCFKAEGAVPVVVAHRAGLEVLFGVEGAGRVVDAVLDPGRVEALWVEADDAVLEMLWAKNEGSKSR
jgi:hypothetical protein